MTEEIKSFWGHFSIYTLSHRVEEMNMNFYLGILELHNIVNLNCSLFFNFI